MKKFFLWSFALSCLSIFAIACGNNNSSNNNQCANQPGTTWNGSTCVYNGYGATSAQCGYQPGMTWNGSTCVYNGGGGYGGYNSSCGGGMVYTYQGCLPQGMCPIGSAQAPTGGCIPAMNMNGGYPQSGYGSGYGGYGYGTGYGAYPNYYNAMPVNSGFYVYGHL